MVSARRSLTMLFADIKGSMELIEDLDPEDARAIVDPALKLMIDAVHHYEGYVSQQTGDGIFALFGAPVAHGDHPQRALFAALRMQAGVKRYAEKLRAEKGVSLQVRVGANVGEVVVREIRTGEKHIEYAPIGHSTGVAARLEALSAPGSTVISDSLRKLVEGYFALKPLGPARIKGSANLWRSMRSRVRDRCAPVSNEPPHAAIRSLLVVSVRWRRLSMLPIWRRRAWANSSNGR